MKKIFIHTSIVVVLLMVFSVFASVSTFAATGTTDTGLSYEANDDIAVITGYVGGAAEVVIPASINGSNVTGILEGAFANNTVIKKVTIEADIRSIPDNCFSNSSIVEVVLPKKLRSIGAKSFADCVSLTKITLPNGMQKIEREAFINCSGLTSMAIPEGVTEIKEYAFKNCSNLTEVSLPNSLTKMNSGAFESCIKLNQIIMPNSITEVTWGAFYGCTGLKKAVLPANLTIIPPSMFQGCTSLKEIKLPNKLEYIGNEAFLDCKALETISIPNSCTTIMAGAFKNCTSLKEIVLPPNIESIDGGIESDGVNQKGIGTFYGCTSLKSVVIPDSCKSIGPTAFKNCTSLSSVYIPSSVTSIAEDAFDNCYFVIISAPKGSSGVKFAKNNYFRFVELHKGSGGEEFSGQIGSGVIDDLKESEKLPILSGDISIIFDEKAVLTIKAQCAGSNVEIQYQLPKNVTAGNNDLKKVIKDVLNIGGKVVDLHLLNASKSNKDVLFGANGGNVTITVPYNAPSGATGVSLFYIDDNGKETEIRGTYNSKDKTVTFTTNHFSYYSIVPLGVKAPQTTPAEPEETKPESTKPSSTESEKPGSTKPSSTESTKPGSAKPGSTEADTTKPESTESVRGTESIESTELETTVPESTETESTETTPSEDRTENDSKGGIGIGVVIFIAVLAMIVGASGCWIVFNYVLKNKNDSTNQ